jgi:Asp-tRNA(Asn)/Glu-tRNA(Gln) amidotransferase A subunit family amidase
VYRFDPPKAPELSGIAYSILTNIAETPVIGDFLMAKIKFDSKIPLIRKFANERSHTAPTVMPLVSSSEAEHKQATKDAETYNINYLLQAERDLKRSTDPRNFKYWTIEDYAAAYKKNLITPLDVARSAIEAIRASESMTPAMNIFIEWREQDILAQAEASAKRIAAGKPLSVLDGVPVAVKDEFHMAGYPTTGGTSFLKTVQEHDATIVHRLKQLGALILGKTNMHEIGIGTTGENWSWGHARNPYNASHHTGGSSAGSAAAVASGLVPVAVSADGGGSIRIPACLTGQYGVKGTFARFSEHGALSLCHSVAHAGPIAATPKDAAIFYALIAGPDDHDLNTQIQPAVHVKDYDKTQDLSDLTIGVYPPYFEDADAEVVAACYKMVKEYERRGARVVNITIPHVNLIYTSHVITITSEMATNFDTYYQQYRQDFSLDTRTKLALARAMSARDYYAAQQTRTWAMGMFEDIFTRQKVDVIASPVAAATAPRIKDTPSTDIASVAKLMRYASVYNMIGSPAVSVPVGYDESNLPIGLQLAADHWDEHTLLRLSNVAEQAVARRAPSVYFDVLGNALNSKK